jgi:hypothetical protein
LKTNLIKKAKVKKIKIQKPKKCGEKISKKNPAKNDKKKPNKLFVFSKRFTKKTKRKGKIGKVLKKAIKSVF